jgi:hypothetical protein
LRPRPRPVGLLRWLRHTKRLSAGATAQVLLSQGAGQVGILAISAVAGLGALGGLRAAQLLLSPATLALAALTPLLLPDLSGNVGPDLRRIRRGAGLASTLGASIVLGYFGVVLLWPQAFTLIFGEPFGVYGALVPFAGLAALAQGVAVGPGLGVRALGEGKAVFLTQAAAVAVGMPVTIVAAARWGAAGAAAGLAAQSAVLCLASWLTYLGGPPRIGESMLSVLTPSFQYGRFLGDALASVLEQNGLEVEDIVQDGGSTDGTVELLRAAPPGVRWVSEPDGGQSDALNRAFARARGEWVAWLNADEFYLPGGLARLLDAAKETGADVVYGDCVFVDEQGRVLRLVPQHRGLRGPARRRAVGWWAAFLGLGLAHLALAFPTYGLGESVWLWWTVRSHQSH